MLPTGRHVVRALLNKRAQIKGSAIIDAEVLDREGVADFDALHNRTMDHTAFE
jgi:hypothetical protein